MIHWSQHKERASRFSWSLLIYHLHSMFDHKIILLHMLNLILNILFIHLLIPKINKILLISSHGFPYCATHCQIFIVDNIHQILLPNCGLCQFLFHVFDFPIMLIFKFVDFIMMRIWLFLEFFNPFCF